MQIDMDKFGTYIKVIWVVTGIISVIAMGLITYVAVHFLGKWW